jgi:hypothetical protein
MYKTAAVYKNLCMVPSAIPKTIDIYFEPGQVTNLFLIGGQLQMNGAGQRLFIKDFTLAFANPPDLAVMTTINSSVGVSMNGSQVLGLDSSTITDISRYMYYTTQVYDSGIFSGYGFGNAFVADNTGNFWQAVVAVKYGDLMQFKTFMPHGFINGTVVKFKGYGATTTTFPAFALPWFVDLINLNTYAVTVIDSHTFSILVNPLGAIDYGRLLSAEVTMHPMESFLYKSTAVLTILDITPAIQLEIIMLKE